MHSVFVSREDERARLHGFLERACAFDAAGAATMMACPPAIMEQARTFASSLGKTRGQRFEAGQLQLLGADGAVVASFAPQSQALAGTAWHVTGYNNGRQAVVSVLSGTELTMEFSADGALAVSLLGASTR